MSATSSKRATARVQERLTKVQAECKRQLATQRELEEQVFFLTGVADEAETRKLMAETALADREWRAARQDLERHRVLLEETRTRLAELNERRDTLLDRLLEA